MIYRERTEYRTAPDLTEERTTRAKHLFEQYAYGEYCETLVTNEEIKSPK